ncbi:hypothetical protein [Hungatella hathewayi]|uniref:hypothetical protein n=1 Tax=Hungatella hathewayi TaxID=154046 RepID=UPI0011DD4ADA|nr:hypothetical protein [Hungatella hathewayi]
MFEKLHPTSQYKVVERTPKGRRYCFLCEVSGTPVYTTGPVRADTPEEELQLAWKEAKPYFNGCSECGKWIRDEAYNIDEMKCIECAPYKSKPRYCPHCGCHVPAGNDYCVRCGKPIQEVVFESQTVRQAE